MKTNSLKSGIALLMVGLLTVLVSVSGLAQTPEPQDNYEFGEKFTVATLAAAGTLGVIWLYDTFTAPALTESSKYKPEAFRALPTFGMFRYRQSLLGAALSVSATVGALSFFAPQGANQNWMGASLAGFLGYWVGSFLTLMCLGDGSDEILPCGSQEEMDLFAVVTSSIGLGLGAALVF